MARIVAYCSGTLGDHLPVIALARALTARGHRVRMVMNAAMVSYARRAGIEAVELAEQVLGPEEARQNAWAWDHWHFPDPFAHPQIPAFDPAAFIAQIKSLIEASRDADLLLATAIRIQGYLTAHILDIPWLTVSMNPYAFWEPDSAIQRDNQRIVRLKEFEFFGMIAREVFAHFGKEWASPSPFPGWQYARHVLLASSPCFYLPDVDQLQPHASVDLTGFWFFEDPAWDNWQADDELRRFCEPDDPAQRPIALTFSSQPLEDARKILQTHVAAAARVERPLLVMSGWAGFSEGDLPAGFDTQRVHFTDFIPHDWVFQRAACTIQHGGIGSIARALRHGCPLLVEPFGNDQMFNAWQVTHLGAGLTLPPFQASEAELVHALHQLLSDPSFRYRARVLGSRIASENGTETACEMIERYLGRLRPDRTPPPLYDRFSPPLTPRQKSIVQPGSPLEYLGEGTTLETKALTAPSIPEEIPKRLHVFWKNRRLPPDLSAYLATWISHHPDWTCLLWTDSDCREFLRKHYAWFLPIYEGYPEPIMRVDAVRYFTLSHCGGLCVELDSECFRPIQPLLAGKQLVFGLEPESHLETPEARQRSLARIVGNAFIASVPRHPFWEYVFKQLVAHHKLPDPLDATGPCLLTQAVEVYPHPEQISLEKAELVYPIDNQQIWLELAEAERAGISRSAFAVHHWQGRRWRPQTVAKTDQIKTTLLSHAATVCISALQLDHAVRALGWSGEVPRISCLMVTGGQRPQNRLLLAQRAIRLFLAQTYPAKELVIIDDGADASLENWLHGECGDALAQGDIVYVRLALEGCSLGELRNAAVAHARGSYVAQWNDDGLSHPQRLMVQMAALQTFQAQACTMERQRLWWPDARRLAVSKRRLWEGSSLCEISCLPQGPHQTEETDTPVLDQLAQRCRMVVVDLPHLYIHVYPGDNSLGKDRWEVDWQEATESWEGAPYQVMLAELQRQFPIELKPTADAGRNAAFGGQAPFLISKADFPCEPVLSRPLIPAGSAHGQEERDPQVVESIGISEHHPGKMSSAGTRKGNNPHVLLLVPVKNVQHWLPTLWTNLHALSYPHDKLSVAFLESDSVDGTYPFLQHQLPSLRQAFHRVELFKEDFHYSSSQPRCSVPAQVRRRSILARSRNHLLSRALRNEDWVLWIDADVARWPADIIQQLLAAEKDIVVPHCLAIESHLTFDYNTFKLDPDAGKIDWTPYLIDGILQSPRGLGRLYLSDLREHHCVEVDAVGASMLLVRADLHREGLIFPPFSYKGYIESEGLAFMARDMGCRCFGLPNVEIFHHPV